MEGNTLQGKRCPQTGQSTQSSPEGEGKGGGGGEGRGGGRGDNTIMDIAFSLNE